MSRFSSVLVLSLLLYTSCEYDRVEPIEPPNPEIPTVTFIKADGANPNDPANQDRITDNVWITRGNNGQIYNASVNSSSNKQSSPVDTEWALGTTENVESLTFNTFRGTIRPKSVVGKDLVLHLITDDIYLDVRFISWSSGGQGGFAYTRTDISAQPQ